MRLLVWRGHLVSCNHACGYCPFAKRKAELATLRRDREALDRFVAHVASDPTPTDVLIMPWGEAMIWPWYAEALATLARLPHVLSCTPTDTPPADPLHPRWRSELPT